MAFNKQPRQHEAIKLMSNNTTTLLEGGSRSGKTTIIMYAIVVRALHFPGTWHLCLRLRLSHVRSSLWMQTLPDVLRKLDVWDPECANDSDLIYRFPNGSMILMDGLDDKDRVEKILGKEYATIYINEASQISWDAYEILPTRLNPPPGVPARCFIDYNPPSTQHWGYKVFHKREFPDGRSVPNNDYAKLLMNPVHNASNLSAGYMDRLQNLSGAKRKRFLEGGYGVQEGALWEREWLKYKMMPADMMRVVVGVDPSGSVEGDEVGIVVAGIDTSGHKHTIADHSMHGTPEEWGNEVVRAYEMYKADCVVAEKNFGGDMVEAVITDMGRRCIKVSLVTASRGKVVRAEPISAMYQRGEITHVQPLIALEDEMCTWNPKDDMESPNRLDALVWAHTELAGGSGALAYV